MNLGSRLKKWLDDNDKSQAWLCEQLPELQIGTVSAIIVRDSSKSKYANQIAKVLGVSLDWLLYGDESAESPAGWPFLSISPDSYAKLDKKQRKIVEDLINSLLANSEESTPRTNPKKISA